MRKIMTIFLAVTLAMSGFQSPILAYAIEENQEESIQEIVVEEQEDLELKPIEEISDEENNLDLTSNDEIIAFDEEMIVEEPEILDESVDYSENNQDQNEAEINTNDIAESKEESVIEEIQVIETPQIIEKEETTKIESEAKNIRLNSINLTASKDNEFPDLNLNIENILYINPTVSDSKINGHAVAWDKTLNMVNNQTKLISGLFNNVGGKNTKAGGLGYQYTFQNEFVLSNGEDKPAYVDDNTSPYIQKIQYKNGNVTVFFKDGTNQVFESTDNISINPLYKATANWYLNYNYIDNISTGSGSWSNLDAVTQYKHTFSNPEIKSPNLTKDFYQFQYWENNDTKDQYVNGDEFVYSSPELSSGETKTINVYAYWKPAVIINLINNNEIINTIRSFESIAADTFDTLNDTETAFFKGWQDENNNIININDVFFAPEITKEKGYLEINLYPYFENKPVDPEPDPEPGGSIIPEPDPDPIPQPTPTPTPTPKPIIPNNPSPTLIVPETITNNNSEILATVEEYPIESNLDLSFTDTTTPVKQTRSIPTTIKENEIPMSNILVGNWALVNLIAMLITILVLIRVPRKDKEEYEYIYHNNILEVIFAIISVLVFIFTENVRLPMILIDSWTPIMLIVCACNIITRIFMRTTKKEIEEEIEE